MKKYYTLIQFDTDLNQWLIVFGDYDIEIVQEEQADIRMGLEVNNRRYGNNNLSCFQIIATGDQQKDIDAKVLEINMKGVNS
jgi:hypothetical protein